MVSQHIPIPTPERVFEFKKALADLHEEFSRHVAMHDEFLDLHKQSLATYREGAAATLDLYKQQLALAADINAEHSKSLSDLQETHAAQRTELEDHLFYARDEATEAQAALAKLRGNLWVRIGRALRLIPR